MARAVHSKAYTVDERFDFFENSLANLSYELILVLLPYVELYAHYDRPVVIKTGSFRSLTTTVVSGFGI